LVQEQRLCSRLAGSGRGDGRERWGRGRRSGLGRSKSRRGVRSRRDVSRLRMQVTAASAEVKVRPTSNTGSRTSCRVGSDLAILVGNPLVVSLIVSSAGRLGLLSDHVERAPLLKSRVDGCESLASLFLCLATVAITVVVSSTSRPVASASIVVDHFIERGI